MRGMTRRGSGFSAAAALVLLASGCRSLSDPEIVYQDCVSPRTPYVEGFDQGDQILTDRCWKRENVGQGREILPGEGDIAIGYRGSEKAQGYLEQPPMLLRRIEGDFVLAVQAEASGAATSDFCQLEPADAAGIVVRRTAPDTEASAMRAVFVLRPFLEEDTNPPRTCEDNSDNPPLAIARAESNEPRSTLGVSPGIGEDGEGEIAVCRIENQLAFYHHIRAEPARGVSEDWEPLSVDAALDGGTVRKSKTTDIGLGPLDVGLTATASLRGASELQVHGYFNWAALLAEGPFGDCKTPLEEFNEPVD
jgi:hypothetical protein